MAAVRDLLGAAGFDLAHHHEESFDFAALPAAAPEAAADAHAQMASTPTHRVEFRKTGRVIDCPRGMNVLEAARRAGLRLPSSCTRGLCGTCKCKLLEGSV